MLALNDCTAACPERIVGVRAAAVARYTEAQLLQVGEHNKHGRVLKAEKLAARTTIYPILQAEEDRRHATLPYTQI